MQELSLGSVYVVCVTVYATLLVHVGPVPLLHGIFVEDLERVGALVAMLYEPCHTEGARAERLESLEL